MLVGAPISPGSSVVSAWAGADAARKASASSAVAAMFQRECLRVGAFLDAWQVAAEVWFNIKIVLRWEGPGILAGSNRILESPLAPSILTAL